VDYYYKLWFAFRIGNLSSDEIEVIEEKLNGIELTIADSAINAGKKVVSFDVKEGKDYGNLFALLEQHHYSPSDYGLFVALTSDDSTTGIDFPEYVLQFYKRTGGQVAISIIITSNIEDGVMHKWADYIITAAKYDALNTKIEKFEVQKDLGGSLEPVTEISREVSLTPFLDQNV
jgi:hypothetical protein